MSVFPPLSFSSESSRGRLAELRRTLDGWGCSPLSQINKQNVHQLQLAWSWSLHTGVSQPNPLVSNGVLYVPIRGGGAQALDAATGAVVWDQKVADPKLGYRYSSGPIVANGKIVAGMTGCTLDARHGRKLRAHRRTGRATDRANMIPKPGDELEFCPSSSGFKSLRAMVSPGDAGVLQPLILNCQKGIFNDACRRRRRNPRRAPHESSAARQPRRHRRASRHACEDGEGHRTRTPPNTSVLTTGGGLAIVGDFDRFFTVHDATTGRVLFQTRLPDDRKY